VFLVLGTSKKFILVYEVQAQEELDEQFARQLMLEEQQQVQQRQQQYRPRSSRIQGQSQQQSQQQQIGSPVGGKDTMAEIQEQVSKYAESMYKRWRYINVY